MDLSWLIYPLAFMVTLGVVVTIHEFGHYAVARYFGVRILRFSVGFGSVLWSKYDRRGTEFCVCAIPLGGYVRLFDSRQDEVAPHEHHEDFSRKPVGARLAVYAGGPFINIAFAVVVFFGLGLVGVTEIRPVIGAVDEGGIAAAAGLTSADEIVAIEGREVKTWSDVSFQLIDAAGTTGSLALSVTNTRDPQAEPRPAKLQVRDFMSNSGVSPIEELGILPKVHMVPAILDVIQEGMPADLAGWRAGDEILTLDSQDIHHWKDVYSYIRSQPSKDVSFELRRDGALVTGMIKPNAVDARDAQERVIQVGRIGAGPAAMDLDPEMIRVKQYNPLEAIGFGFEQTWIRTRLVIVSIGKLLTGALALDNVTGPVTIAEIAGKTAQSGLSSMLNFLGYLSISLGVFNLLPVPMLDGGHIAYGIVELIRGRPVSVRAQQRGMAIGFALLGSVMVLALFNDFARLFAP